MPTQKDQGPQEPQRAVPHQNEKFVNPSQQKTPEK